MGEKRAPLQEAEAFSLLYQSTYLAVFRFIYGLLNGPQEEVEDLTGETFMRAWRTRHRFQGDHQAALSWLFRIARNLVIDQYRRDRSHPQVSCAGADLDLMLCANAAEIQSGVKAQGVEDQVSLGEQLGILMDLLQSLPTDQRELIVLRYIVDWPVKQIAQHLEMKENTVSVYLRRILKQLKTQWPRS
jgi:RNA polymerase sigma-70 factor (ECF subfamily)